MHGVHGREREERDKREREEATNFRETGLTKSWRCLVRLWWGHAPPLSTFHPPASHSLQPTLWSDSSTRSWAETNSQWAFNKSWLLGCHPYGDCVLWGLAHIFLLCPVHRTPSQWYSCSQSCHWHKRRDGWYLLRCRCITRWPDFIVENQGPVLCDTPHS